MTQKSTENQVTKQKKILNGGFHQIPNEAEFLDIYEYRILGHIIRRCGASHGGECYESVNQAASLCGVSRRKYLYVLKTLEDKKVIIIEKEKGKTNVITWNHPSKWDIDRIKYKKPDHQCTSDAPVHDVHHTSAPDAQVPVHDVHHTSAPDAPPSSILVEEDPNKKIQLKEDPDIKSELAPLQSENLDVLQTELLRLLDDWRMYLYDNADRWKCNGIRVWGNGIEQSQAIAKLIAEGHSLNDIEMVFAYWKSGKSWYKSLLTPKNLIKETDGQSLFSRLYSSASSYLATDNYARARLGTIRLQHAIANGDSLEAPF